MELKKNKLKTSLARKMTRKGNNLAWTLLFASWLYMLNYFYGVGIAYVKGNSMYPTYKQGDIALFAKWKKPKVDDVVIVRTSYNTMHRVKRVGYGEKDIYKDRDKLYLVAGENAESLDQVVYDENIKGVVIFPKR